MVVVLGARVVRPFGAVRGGVRPSELTRQGYNGSDESAADWVWLRT